MKVLRSSLTSFTCPYRAHKQEMGSVENPGNKLEVNLTSTFVTEIKP